MKTLELSCRTGHSKIVIGESLQNLPGYVRSEKAVIVTDRRVRRLYERVFPPYPVVEIGTGERIKVLETVRDVYSGFVHLEVDRSSVIVGIGGGVVCDISGFAASTFMRGIRFGFVASTLLAQVDAGVGGKNGVNFMGCKNMIGVFNQPEFVICDTGLLRSLPLNEIRCGMAEIVKHAVISDPGLFSYLEKNHEKALKLNAGALEKIVHDSLLVKTSIVSRDERETSERMKLNFGHTFGHALEATQGLAHGEAVSLGMMIASLISVKMGFLSEEDMTRIKALLKKLGLPTGLPLDGKGLSAAIRRDKKRRNDAIRLVLLRAVGNAVLERIPIGRLEAMIKEIGQERFYG